MIFEIRKETLSSPQNIIWHDELCYSFSLSLAYSVFIFLTTAGRTISIITNFDHPIRYYQPKNVMKLVSFGIF